MADLIDRQAAIDAILSVTGNSSVRELYEHVQEHGLSDMWSGGVNAAIDTIIAVPSAQPEQRWIPCSERLPHMYGWYLCTLIDGRVNAYYWNNNGVWLDNAKKHLFDLYEIRSRYTGMEIKPEDEAVYWTEWVVAWMPMPEPYREEGE